MSDFRIPSGVRSCNWDGYEDEYTAEDDNWTLDIGAHTAADAKWGIRGSLERCWEATLWPDGYRGRPLEARGSSVGLPAAKRDALAALRELADRAAS